MMNLSLVMMFGGFLFDALSFIASIKAFEKLVDYQYENHKSIWEADDRPKGGRMTRKELSFFGSDFASTVCSLSWALSRPSWISARSMAENVRVKMIRWFIISFVGFFVFSGGMVLFIVTLKDAG